MTLSFPLSQPSQRRPHQSGFALGTKGGAPVREPVEWLVDTGADIGSVNGTIGGKFDTSSVVGVSAHPLAGAAIAVVTGIDVEVSILDTSTGVSGPQQTAGGRRYVAVSSRTGGTNLIGMNQLAELQATVRWCPNTQTGALEA